MSRTSWDGNGAPFIIVAIGLIVIALTVVHLSYSKAYHNAYEDAHRDGEAYDEYQKTAQECRSNITVNRAVDCIIKAEKAERERHNIEQDLTAQRQMADSAWWMMVATFGTVGVTSFGVYLIHITLNYTKTAAEHTEGMLEEARKTTKASMAAANAASQANQLSQKEFVIRQKPQLQVEISGPYIDESKYPMNQFAKGEGPRWTVFNAHIEITNESRSVAKIIKSDVAIFDHKNIGINRPPPQDVFEFLSKNDVFRPCCPIPSITKKGVPPHYDLIGDVGAFNLTHEGREALHMNGHPPIVGRIYYRDWTGKNWIFGFAFRPRSFWTEDFVRWGGDSYNYDKEADV